MQYDLSELKKVPSRYYTKDTVILTYYKTML